MTWHLTRSMGRSYCLRNDDVVIDFGDPQRDWFMSGAEGDRTRTTMTGGFRVIGRKERRVRGGHFDDESIDNPEGHPTVSWLVMYPTDRSYWCGFRPCRAR